LIAIEAKNTEGPSDKVYKWMNTLLSFVDFSPYALRFVLKNSFQKTYSEVLFCRFIIVYLQCIWDFIPYCVFGG
jgi:hypothetical protein